MKFLRYAVLNVISSCKKIFFQSNPLSIEVAGESLSLLCKTGSGMAHAYVRIDIKDK